MLNMSNPFDGAPPAEGHNSRHFNLDRDRRPKNIFGVSRDIFKHSYVGAGNAGRQPWTRMEAWLSLCAKANYRPSQIDVRGDIVTLDRGQLVTTQPSLAEEWGWTVKQVRGFLDGLEHRAMIGRKTGTPKGSHQTLPSISNYELYQFLENHLGQTKGTPKGSPRAARGPQSNTENTENTKDSGNGPLFDEVREALEAWNAMAEQCGLSQEELTADLRPKIRARLKDSGGLDGWRAALAKVAASDFLCGKVKDFKANLDFIVKPDKFRSLRRGDYDNRSQQMNGAAHQPRGRPGR
jgi:hypothetical protein